MKLYFARHGQTDTNKQAVNQPSAGNDEALNDLGIQQANELAEQLKGVKFDVLISSPLKRSLQTAEIVNKHHDLEIIIDDAWRELPANGYVDINIWNDLFDFSKNASAENIEPLTDFFKRVYDALDKLVTENSDKTVLVVSHGGVQNAVYAYANKLPLTGNMRISPMRNCEYRVYEL